MFCLSLRCAQFSVSWAGSLKLGVSRKQVPSYQASTGIAEPERPECLSRRPVRAPLNRKLSKVKTGWKFPSSADDMMTDLIMPSKMVAMMAAACIPAWSRADQ